MTKAAPGLVELPSVSRPAPLERICCEVNSRCGSLRAASRLLPNLSGPEAREMLLLMAAEALRLAESLEKRCQGGL